jgi:ribosomal protein S18 acetylase RimI-like enzyme
VAELITRLETYYDAAPRASAHVEDIGPLTLFVADRGWPYYARPRLGVDAEITEAQVRAVLARQAQLGLPQSLEWVHQVTPSLLPAATKAGLQVEQCPLLVLDELSLPPPPADVTVRMLDPDDREHAGVHAAVEVGFSSGGTERGSASVQERDAMMARTTSNPAMDAHRRSMMEQGLLATAGAFDASGAIGGGSHSPRSDITEITGVAVLPAARRRGVGALLTAALATDAGERGVDVVFCSAASHAVARVYQSIGFRRVGTACIATLPR